MTMALDTHGTGFARQVTDTVCFLHDGDIHDQSRPEQVIGGPRQERTSRFRSRLHT